MQNTDLSYTHTHTHTHTDFLSFYILLIVGEEPNDLYLKFNLVEICSQYSHDRKDEPGIDGKNRPYLPNAAGEGVGPSVVCF